MLLLLILYYTPSLFILLQAHFNQTLKLLKLNLSSLCEPVTIRLYYLGLKILWPGLKHLFWPQNGVVRGNGSCLGSQMGAR